MTESKDEPEKKVKEIEREVRDTQQEMMFELKIKTDALLEKLKKLRDKDRVKFGNM